MSNVYEASEEDDCQRRAIIFDEFPYVALEEVAASYHSTEICNHQYQEGNHDGEICRFRPCKAVLSGQNLYTFLEVDEGNVKAKDVAAEARHVGQAIASVGYSKSPVHDHRPPVDLSVQELLEVHSSIVQADPTHEWEVINSMRNYDVIDRVVEHCDRTCIKSFSSSLTSA